MIRPRCDADTPLMWRGCGADVLPQPENDALRRDPPPDGGVLSQKASSSSGGMLPWLAPPGSARRTEQSALPVCLCDLSTSLRVSFPPVRPLTASSEVVPAVRMLVMRLRRRFGRMGKGGAAPERATPPGSPAFPVPTCRECSGSFPPDFFWRYPWPPH